MSPESEELTPRLLSMFAEMGKEELDLHELFEAGGNDPEARRAVLYAVETLVGRGLLEERGNDFYALTPAGRESAARAREEARGDGAQGGGPV
jgi:DNA-binding PadR family transcriptional regulator